MTTTDERSTTAPPHGATPSPRGPLPRWKKILLGAAAVLVAAGLAMLPFRGSSGDLSTSQGPGTAAASQQDPLGGGGIGSQFAPGGSGTDQDGNPRPSDSGAGAGGPQSNDLSPVFLKLGFSFFVGFAIGYAFRQFLKLALIFVGLQFVILFGLTALDWVSVEWEVMGTAWDGFIAQLGGQLESFRSFVAGGLPQAGLASLGLFTGFKRN